jgi:hypothetical protein
MRKALLIPVLCGMLALNLSSCEQATPAAEELKGEWRYVGTFSHLADYTCLVCPDFDYEKSLYRITFSDSSRLSARINLLIATGTYLVFPQEKMNGNDLGKFELTQLQILNKPPETAEDSQFQNRLRNSNSYYVVYENDGPYDYLQLQFSENEYLYFVRKKSHLTE